MPSLTLLESFTTTAREGSFAKAAISLGVSASAVGKAISRLEVELGTALFQRTTRHLELTEEGRLLLSGLSPALSALDEAIEQVRNTKERIAGHLTLTVPLVGYHFLNDNIGAFLCAHPDVEIEVRFADAMVDLVADGVDLGIRNGPLRDSSLKQRHFRPFYHGLFASPEYLARRGEPRLETLDSHDRIAYRFSSTGQLQSWRSRDGTGITLLPPRIIVNSIEGARSAAVAGLGITWLPDFVLRDDLETGRLVRILKQEIHETGEFFLVWPASKAEPLRLRALIDHLITSQVNATLLSQ